MSLSPPPELSEQVEFARRYLRAPTSFDEAGKPIWDPPLTAQEQVILQRIRDLLKSALRVTPDEWQSISDEVTGLTQYHGLPNPTNAQSVAAIKAIIRVLRVVLRD